MATKHPTAVNINRSAATRPYAQDQGGYVQKVRRVTDTGIQYILREFNAFMKSSELKKPYMSPTYDDMEYGNVPWNPPTPNPIIPTPPVLPGPVPPPPPPGPIPGPIPGPVPPILPLPPPWDNVYFCQIPPFEFCPGGGPVMVPVTTNDGISGVNVLFEDEGSASGAGNSIIYNPGGSSYVNIIVTTRHGATCSGMGTAKDPDECQNCTGSIGYTTTGMQVNETQQLTANCGGGGTCTPSWSVSGGGSITGDGLYTAPSSNANCSNNPTISLICDGHTMATLSIAVNGYSGSEIAYWDAIAGSPADCIRNIYRYRFNCAGNSAGTPIACFGCDASGQDPCMNCCLDWVLCIYCGCDGGNWNPGPTLCTTSYVLSRCIALNGCGAGIACSGITDVRTAEMKTAGCCPVALL